MHTFQLIKEKQIYILLLEKKMYRIECKHKYSHKFVYTDTKGKGACHKGENQSLSKNLGDRYTRTLCKSNTPFIPIRFNF